MFRKAVLSDVDAITAIYEAIHDGEEAGLTTIGWVRDVYPTRKTAEDSIDAGDLFVLEEYRGRGYGKALLRRLAQIALERGCGRLEWCCLDWNQPSIDFYRSLGAVPMSDWTTYRLTGETLSNMAKE